MNEAVSAPADDIDADGGSLGLGITYEMDLGQFLWDENDDASNAAEDHDDEIDQDGLNEFLAELTATTTLTDLTVRCELYEPTPERNRRILEPFCQCLANLRNNNNKHHPLRELFFGEMDLSNDGMVHVLEQLLIATKQCGGIVDLSFASVFSFPIRFFVEFCRDNHPLENLNLGWVTFTDQQSPATQNWPPPPIRDDQPSNASNATPAPESSMVVLPALHKLRLDDVTFQDADEALTFIRYFLDRVNVVALELGRVSVRDAEYVLPGEVYDEENDYHEICDRIVSTLLRKPSSVQVLWLIENHRYEHYQMALEAGTTTTSVTELGVVLNSDSDGDVSMKLQMLANFIRDAVQLQTVTIHGEGPNKPTTLHPQFFQAIQQCATVTQIRVNHSHGERTLLSPSEVQQLQSITTRNVELGRFIASPGTYPIHKLPLLLFQCQHCPTGRFRLARSLPSAICFEDLRARILQEQAEAKEKKRKAE